MGLWDDWFRDTWDTVATVKDRVGPRAECRELMERPRVELQNEVAISEALSELSGFLEAQCRMRTLGKGGNEI